MKCDDIAALGVAVVGESACGQDEIALEQVWLHAVAGDVESTGAGKVEEAGGVQPEGDHEASVFVIARLYAIRHNLVAFIQQYRFLAITKFEHRWLTASKRTAEPASRGGVLRNAIMVVGAAFALALVVMVILVIANVVEGEPTVRDTQERTDQVLENIPVTDLHVPGVEREDS